MGLRGIESRFPVPLDQQSQLLTSRSAGDKANALGFPRSQKVGGHIHVAERRTKSDSRNSPSKGHFETT